MQTTLTRDEAELLRAYRRAKAFSDAPPEIPERLYDHGTVTAKEAARLLDVTPEQLKELASSGRVGLAEGGAFVLSELLQEAERRQTEQLEALRDKALAVVFREVCGRGLQLLLDGREIGRQSRSLRGVADELGVGMTEARRLVESGTLFGRRSCLGHVHVSAEELEAYQRAQAFAA